MDNLRTWFVGASFLVILVGGIIAFIAGRPIEQLSPFFGIILVQILSWASTKVDIKQVQTKVNGYLSEHHNAEAEAPPQQ